MLCELVSVADPALRGLIAVDLKLRTLWSLAGRDNVLLLLREECCDKCSWWQGERDKYSGRLIVLAHFSERGNEKFDLHGDLRVNREGAWRGFYGWPHSRPDWVLPVAIPKAAPKAKATQHRRRQRRQHPRQHRRQQLAAKDGAQPYSMAFLGRMVLLPSRLFYWRSKVRVVKLTRLIGRTKPNGITSGLNQTSSRKR